ncbi:MAG: ATP-binding protein [Candidatus Peregrinibacteria bacterium]
MSPLLPVPIRRSIHWQLLRQFLLLAVFAVLLCVSAAYYVMMAILQEQILGGAQLLATEKNIIILVNTLVTVTTFIILLAILLAHFLARGVAQPLLLLSSAVEKLDAEHWSFQRKLKTGDEVEFLESKIDDMARRLRMTYEYLEEEVTKRTETIRIQSAKDRTILTSIHHGILVCDAQGIVQDSNPAARSMIGKENIGVDGRPFDQIFVLSRHQKILPIGEHPVQRCLIAHDIIHQEPNDQLSILRPDRSRVPIMIMVSPLMVGDEFLGAIAVFHDITEERKLDYMKSEFISLASHQLRTPLSAITWYLELLTSDEHEPLTAMQKSYVQEMQDASSRMAHLIDDLLHASVLEGGNITPTLKPTDIVTIVRESTENSQSQAKDRSIGLSIILPEHSIMVNTDPTLVQMVINNLLSNAVKYSNPGSTVTIGLHTDVQQVQVTVADKGVGIPEEDKIHIFGRLFRASNVVKMDTNGTGLGLYISHLIAGQLGGSLTFESKIGEGTTFTLALPLGKQKKV